ncbi:hydrogenase 4 subunit B [Falsiroseomonas bella]|uniref:Hydrogenase 4 subunit B n=1 Tax=Falsiroseomonas bella TaxID=2184016 RepID=A0A317FJV2_9PROT|nr:proton-conducting transporter membrane subunit [Falsiroseomonas bella]PWS38239.1 hydrogenase 4 subunit B [Falsiroseomonas bella]
MLTAILLTLLGLVLLALAMPVLAGRRIAPRLAHGGSALASAVFVLMAVAALAGGGAPVAELPFGTPFGPLLVALDGLSAWFLLLLGLAGLCASVFALAHEDAAPARALLAYPLFLAGMALTLLAADGVTLLLGFEAMSLASWALVASDHAKAENRRAARLYLVFAALAAVCLVPALGLLAGPGGDLAFAAIREAPPDGWRAALILALVVAGAGAKAGLVPLHAWLPLAHPAAPSHVSALMSAAMTKVALYVAARMLLDLGGPAQPVWWGVPLVALGAASAVLGALRANLEEEGKTLLAFSTIENVGLVAVGLGLAACFRAADLGALAALAAGAALLHALNHGVFKTLLFLGMGEVAHGAGSRLLDRLGGLIHAMPWTAACMLVGVGAAASLPPLSGFASEWLLLQALIAAWRVGDLTVQMLVLVAAAMVALAAALAAAAMVRLFGLVFLGRPRSPRGAGAHEGKGAARLSLLLPAGLTVLLGLLPGPMLALGGGAQALLTGQAMEGRAGLAFVAVGDGAAAYWPLGAALLLALALFGVWLLVKRGTEEPARGPAWDCGFAAPPQHLPFGDPLTQPTAAGMGQPLRRMLAQPVLAVTERVEMPEPGTVAPARIAMSFGDPAFALLLAPLATARDAVVARTERLRDLSIRQCLMLPFAALVALLLLVAWLEGGA